MPKTNEKGAALAVAGSPRPAGLCSTSLCLYNKSSQFPIKNLDLLLSSVIMQGAVLHNVQKVSHPNMVSD